MDKKTNQMLFGLGIVLTIGGLYYIMKKKLEVSNKSDAEEGLTEPEKKVIEVQEPSALVSGDFKNKLKRFKPYLVLQVMILMEIRERIQKHVLKMQDLV
jgi:hypothetical protein